MPRLFTLKCDICGKTEAEPSPGAGLMGWGAVQGVQNGDSHECILCPEHLVKVAELLTSLEEKT